GGGHGDHPLPAGHVPPAPLHPWRKSLGPEKPPSRSEGLDDRRDGRERRDRRAVAVVHREAGVRVALPAVQEDEDHVSGGVQRASPAERGRGHRRAPDGPDASGDRGACRARGLAADAPRTAAGAPQAGALTLEQKRGRNRNGDAARIKNYLRPRSAAPPLFPHRLATSYVMADELRDHITLAPK